ncbi:hypothetical protein J6590_077008 [Homalodisca vitripennis]|nr:hypothetical protein J6590_077008 [Homalodisca vitripennis]
MADHSSVSGIIHRRQLDLFLSSVKRIWVSGNNGVVRGWGEEREDNNAPAVTVSAGLVCLSVRALQALRVDVVVVTESCRDSLRNHDHCLVWYYRYHSCLSVTNHSQGKWADVSTTGEDKASPSTFRSMRIQIQNGHTLVSFHRI